jgi:hypothetical protein
MGLFCYGGFLGDVLGHVPEFSLENEGFKVDFDCFWMGNFVPPPWELYALSLRPLPTRLPVTVTSEPVTCSGLPWELYALSLRLLPIRLPVTVTSEPVTCMDSRGNCTRYRCGHCRFTPVLPLRGNCTCYRCGHCRFTPSLPLPCELYALLLRPLPIHSLPSSRANCTRYRCGHCRFTLSVFVSRA